MDIIRYLKVNKGIEFTPQQEKIINHIDGPALAIAVAGAGKTTVLQARIANLIFTYGIPSKNILTMTFSRASANDMKERFNFLFSDLANENKVNIKFSTIHSFAYGVVNKYHKYKELIEPAKYGKVSKTTLLKNIYKLTNGSYIEEDKLDELSTAISYIKNKMIDITKLSQDDIQGICGIENFGDIFNKYEGHKRANGYIDFDDMLSICYDILISNQVVLDFYRETFDYIQLDEAQDTSKIQFSIVELLASPKNNIFYLGDLNQTIYSYRGSEISNLMDFGRKYPNGTVYFMEQNFRSTKDIIGLSNEFIKTNKERMEVNMFTENDNNRPVAIVNVEDEKDEIEYIIDKFKNYENNGTNAILYRNNLLAVPLINQLSKHKIPFYIREQDNRFFTHWVVADILAFIRLSLDKHDLDSLSKIYYKTNLYISKEVLYDSTKYNDGCGCLDALLKLSYLEEYQRDNIDKFKANLDKLKTSKGKSIAFNILSGLGYEDYLIKNATKLGYSFENLSNIISVFKIITEDCNNLKDVLAKMKELYTLMKTSSNNKGDNIVTLTSIHGSKGLEWDNVYIMSMVENIFPSRQSVIKAAEGDESLLEEERRLCYVAITRGKSYVDLIVLKNKNNNSVAPSKFIKEIRNIMLGKSAEEDTNVAINNQRVDVNSIFKSGDKVKHKQFGFGEVKSVNLPNDIITIMFNDKGTKRLMYSLCRDGILSLV